MNETEKKFYEQAKKRGWQVYRNGYPDFLLVSPNNPKHVFFVEVKKGHQKLSKAQEEIFKVFRRLGVDVAISFNGRWVDPIAKMYINQIERNVETIREARDKLRALQKEVDTIVNDVNGKVNHLHKIVENVSFPWDQWYRQTDDCKQQAEHMLLLSSELLQEIEGDVKVLKKYPKPKVDS